MLAHPSYKLSNKELDKKTCVTLCCNIKPKATDSSWLIRLAKAQVQEVTDVACLHFTVHFFFFLKGPKLYKFHLPWGTLLLGRDKTIEIWCRSLLTSAICSVYSANLFLFNIVCISSVWKKIRKPPKKKNKIKNTYFMNKCFPQKFL